MMLSKLVSKEPSIFSYSWVFFSAYLMLSLSSLWILLVAYYQVSNIEELLFIPSLIKRSANTVGFIVFYLSNIVPVGLFFMGLVLAINSIIIRKKSVAKVATVVSVFLGVTSLVYLKFSFFILAVVFFLLFKFDPSNKTEGMV